MWSQCITYYNVTMTILKHQEDAINMQATNLIIICDSESYRSDIRYAEATNDTKIGKYPSKNLSKFWRKK